MLELLINIQEVDDTTALSIPRGLYINNETDKQMVIEAMDHSYVHAWRERWKWWERSLAIAAVIKGKGLLSKLPYIKEGYTNAEAAYQQAVSGHAGAQWHQALFGMVRDTVEETVGDPNNLVQINTHVQPVITGIHKGLNIMRQRQVAEAAKHGKPVPAPKYTFEMEEVGVIHYDYTRQRMTVVPLGALGLGPGKAIPEQSTATVGPYHEGVTKDGSPAIQWLMHYLFGRQKPAINPDPSAPGVNPPKAPESMVSDPEKKDVMDKTRGAVQDALTGTGGATSSHSARSARQAALDREAVRRTLAGEPPLPPDQRWVQ